MVKGLEGKLDEEQLRALGLQLEETEGRPHCSYSFLTRGRQGTGTDLFSVVTSDRSQGNRLKLGQERCAIPCVLLRHFYGTASASVLDMLVNIFLELETDPTILVEASQTLNKLERLLQDSQFSLEGYSAHPEVYMKYLVRPMFSAQSAPVSSPEDHNQGHAALPGSSQPA
ncbi:hypothetical protein WISP_37309 [Willisornis vidua]|uniref:Uncharacterized protein n=1 Tax=Willisornis vidua TaxID=1566151 RepID=A0ABQ9DNB4_9PASS|nr:hypothetical protein WISP_37309 [Willisornis vidua]